MTDKHKEEIKAWAKVADEAISNKARKYSRVADTNQLIICEHLEMEYNSVELAKDFGQLEFKGQPLYLIEKPYSHKEGFRALAVDLDGDLFFVEWALELESHWDEYSVEQY